MKGWKLFFAIVGILLAAAALWYKIFVLAKASKKTTYTDEDRATVWQIFF